ncbi:MAG: DUF3455 domain-containing protein [Burkholderiaceae bacterium]
MKPVSISATATAAAATVLALAAGCAAPAAPPAPEPPPIAIPVPTGVPAALQPADGQEPFLRGDATGVQIYECSAKADAPGGFAWVFKAPEAMLVDAAGKPIVHHDGGPTWTSLDGPPPGREGASIVGAVQASAPSPEPRTIPWLLLGVKSHAGHGVLDSATSVQRLATAGGAAPSDGCGAATEHQLARVNYTATYVFWRAKAGAKP